MRPERDNRMENEAAMRKEAEIVYATVRKALDEREWHYDADDQKLSVECGVRGDDLSIPLKIFIDEKRQRVVLYSHIPFDMAEDKRVEGAIVTGMASYSLADGCFDYNMENGAILFRMSNSYRESILGVGLINYMISCAVHTVDEYNDRFLMVSKGLMSVAQFKELG